jgi:flagellar motor component MotA
MYLIGVAAFVFSFSTAIVLKGVSPGVFANPAVILTILFTLVSTVLATGNFKLFIRGCNAVLSRKYYMPDEERRQAAELFHLLSKVTVAASVFVMFTGLIAMLGHMSDTELFGHAIAAALTAPLFAAAVPVALFEPAVFVLRHRSDAPERVMKSYPKALGDKLLELCYQNGLNAEDIENATGIELRSEPRDR